MSKAEKNQKYQQQIAGLQRLHAEDVAAGGEFPPFNRTESRDHHQSRPAWADEKQAEFGAHRRGPTRNG